MGSIGTEQLGLPTDPKLIETVLGRAVSLEKVAKVEEKKKLKGVGFLSKMHLLTLEGKDGEVVGQVVVKLPPADEGAAAFVKSAKLHFVEREFYRHYSANMELKKGAGKVPKCFFPLPEDNNSGEEDLLVLEFCEGAVPDFFQGLSSSQTKVSLSALAELHASLWSDNKGKCPSWLPDSASTASRNTDLFEGCIAPKVLDRLMKELIAGGLEEGQSDRLKATLLNREGIEKVMNRTIGSGYHGPLSVMHGDLWSGNTLIEEDKQQVTFVDWQFVCFANPILDVAVLLGSSTAPSDWQGKEEEVLKTYVEALNSAFSALGRSSLHYYSLEECCKAFREALPYSFLMLAASAEAWIPENQPPKPLVLERYVSLGKYILELNLA